MASSEDRESHVPGNAHMLRSGTNSFQHFFRDMPLQDTLEGFVFKSVLNQGLQTTRLSVSRSSDQDSFCGCYTDRLKVFNCVCGEFGKRIEWVWDKDSISNCIDLGNRNKDVKFHQFYSNGTAVIRGAQPMSANQHYWEVKMISPVYGTDMMVGVGTKNVNVYKLNNQFCSVLGIDDETWGLSYTGSFHHKGEIQDYAPRFGQGSIIGVHLDLWNGTISFYKNRKPLGVASTGLRGKTLYAMASSTAARSGMRIIHSCSFPSSLQFLCCSKLREMVPADKNVLSVINVPPGLQSFLKSNLGWLLGESPLDENDLKQSCPSFMPHKWIQQCAGSPSSMDVECSTVAENSFHDSSLDDLLENSSDSRFVLLESPNIVLQDFNRFRRDPLELTFDRDYEESSESDPKKFKYSYNYMVGLSDPDSD